MEAKPIESQTKPVDSGAKFPAEQPTQSGSATFGKYRLIAELGHGGMADVFLAVQTGPAGSGFSKLTVVKRLRANLAEDPEFVNMLVDEARIAARLNHPNVVQTNEVGSVGNQYFIAMEYLEGQPLHRIQHRANQGGKPLPTHYQYVAICDALSGLHHAHELKDYDGTPLEIVHRDVTPHNLFVTYEGQVKVVDFGIAKAAGRTSETQQGVVKGKVRYMAPEQALGKGIDRRSDIFAAGVMLWEIATGERLWKGMDDLQIVQALLSGEIRRSPRAVKPEVPEVLDRIIQKSLAPKKEDRYANADEFKHELEQYLADAGLLIEARRKLGPAVLELFKDRRDELKKVIDGQLAQLAAKPSGLRTVFVPMELPSSPTPSSTGPVTMSAVPDDPTMLLPQAAPQKKGGARGMVIGLGVVAVAAVVAYALVPKKPAAANIDPTPTPTEVSPTPQPNNTGPAVENDMQLAITAISGARIFIDGLEVPNPYNGRRTRDGADHAVKVSLDGKDLGGQMVRFDRDQNVDLTHLTPAKTAAKAPPVGPVRGGHTTAAKPPEPAAPTPPAAPVETKPPPEATDTPVKKGRPKRELDTANPFGN